MFIIKPNISFFDKILSIGDFGKVSVLNTSNIRQIEKWQLCLDQRSVFGILLTDLSKVFNSFSQKLLVARLNAYVL